MYYLEQMLLNTSEVQKLKEIGNLPSKHHIHPTVYDHTVAVLHQANKMYFDDPVMITCAILHDIGKAYTRSVSEKTGMVQFINHADISFKLAKPMVEQLHNLEELDDEQRDTGRGKYILVYPACVSY